MRRTGILAGVALVMNSVLVTAPPTEAAPHTCNGKVATIVGSSGNNILTGTMKDDVIVGLGGKDFIKGLGGDDTICGGSGDDLIIGGAGNDTILGGSGYDRLHGGSGADVLHGQVGNDLIIAGSGNDKLVGGPGFDALYGQSGNDRIIGGSNADVLYGGPGSDTLFGQSGRDILYGGPGSATAYGGTSIDACYEALEPGGTCDPDQLYLAGEDNIEPSDLLHVAEDHDGITLTAVADPVVNSHRYDRGIGCKEFGNIYDFDFCEFSFSLAGKYTRFAARVGHLDENSAPDADVRFDLIGDGSVIATRTVSLGQAPTVIANITGVSQLDLRITTLNDTNGDVLSKFLWLDPRIAARSGLKPSTPVALGN